MEGKHAYVLIPAEKSWLRRLLSPIVSLDAWWLTYRLPFQQVARITHPRGHRDPANSPTIKHEVHHVAQFAPWYGPIWVILAQVFPLPVLFSGRWFVERGAYLDDIRNGRRSLERAVQTLWHSYGYCWPKSLMRKWFNKQLAIAAAKESMK